MPWHQHQQEIGRYFCTTQLDPAVLERWTAPFIPWRGRSFAKSPIKILFVGKSVAITHSQYDAPWAVSLAQWREGGCPDTPEATERYIREKVALQLPPSDAFWVVPLMLAGALLNPNIPYAEVFQHIAWTNLYKTTDQTLDQDEQPNYGPPAPQPCNAAQGICQCIDCTSKKWLTKEISLLDPHVIVLGVGPDVATRLFPRRSMDDLPRQLTNDERNDLGIRDSSIAWLTWHFSAWTWRAEKHGDVLRQIRQALLRIEHGVGR